MSGVKGGLSGTLNRLWGKKNKDSSLSKSTSNLSQSMSQLPTAASSQHNYSSSNNNNNNNSNINNKILPLQSMSNAPFEQTFRITVQLPRDQLYVARLGAKTQLHVLLKMVCDDKSLDTTKYEFRHPRDMSQAYDNDNTIGFVGLNELRLVLKTEKYHNPNTNNFNTDEIIKLRNGSAAANHGSNNSTKTSLVSPYSSTNSLNSIDSSGMMSNTSSRGGSVVGQHPPIAPSRKKRAAPRPPSQNSIPENKDVNFNNNINMHNNNNNNSLKEFKSPLPPTIENTTTSSMSIKKTFHVSSPNLVSNFSLSGTQKSTTTTSTTTTTTKDIYDDTSNINDNNNNQPIKTTNGHDNRYSSANDLHRMAIQTTTPQQRPMSMHIPYESTASNRSSVSSTTTNTMESATIINHSRTSSESSEQYPDNGNDKPEPTPRRRLFSGSKTKKPPAPQPRGLPPVPTPRLIQGVSKERLNEMELNQTNEIIKNNINNQKVAEIESRPIANGAVKSVIASNENGILPSPPVVVDKPRNLRIFGNGRITPVADAKKEVSPTIDERKNASHVTETKKISPVLNERKDLEGESQLNGNVSKVMLNVVDKKQIVEDPIVKKPAVIDTKPISNSSSRNSSISISVNTNDHSQNSIETNSVISSEEGDDLSIGNENHHSKKLESSDEDVDGDKMKIYNLKLGKSITNITQNVEPAEMRILKSIEQEEICPEVASIRSPSPLWTYTLPAPPTFADSADISSTAMTDNLTSMRDDMSSMDNLTIVSNSTIDSELIIKPVINEKVKIDADEIIRNNSDIEDGYHGGDLETKRKLSRESLKTKSLQNETIENRKNHVIEELHNVITDNRLEKLISRQPSQDDNHLVNSNLSNFKMSTYAPFGTVTTNGNHENKMRRNSSTKTSINRSDSFHSTRIDAKVVTSELSLPRSSSYLSLNETVNGRRKSSAGSLHESPSLQSLEVMKMILPGLNSGNSSKRNSINVNEDEQLLRSMTKRNSIVDEIVSSPLKRTSPVEEEQQKKSGKSITAINYTSTEEAKPPPQPIVEPTKIEVKQKITNATVPVETNDAENNSKKWKYSGPPAINLSSWAERPKIQVAIKSDRDYKFGGALNNHNMRNHQNSDSAETTEASMVEQKNLRNETERKLPIVRGVEYKKSAAVTLNQEETAVELPVILRPKPVLIPINQQHQEKETPPIVLRPKPEITTRPNFYQTFSRPNTIHVNGNYNGGTSGGGVQNKFTPYVRGFRTEPTNTSTTTVNSNNTVSIESIVNMPNRHPSFSKGNAEAAHKIVNGTSNTNISNNAVGGTSTTNSNNTVGPFGQNTLRRTGLKDKIVLTGENRMRPAASEIPAQQIHLKQQETVVKSTFVNSNGGGGDVVDSGVISHNRHSTNSIGTTNIVIKSNSNSSSNSSAEMVAMAPPPPPAPKSAPVVRSVVVKKSKALPDNDVDPRDQLLAAIKNFNRDALKRS